MAQGVLGLNNIYTSDSGFLSVYVVREEGNKGRVRKKIKLLKFPIPSPGTEKNKPNGAQQMIYVLLCLKRRIGGLNPLNFLDLNPPCPVRGPDLMTPRKLQSRASQLVSVSALVFTDAGRKED